MRRPCDVCAYNGLPHCGNEWCHTNVDEDYEKDWVVDCTSCGSKSISYFKHILDKGCPSCCSFKIEIYHKKNLNTREDIGGTF